MTTDDDDTMPPDDDEVENANDLSSSRDNTDKSKPRKPRGPNKRTWAINGNSEPMEFNKEGKAIGLRSKDLNKYISEVGRDMKLDVPDFRLMPSGQIKWAWRCISDRIAWTDDQDKALKSIVKQTSMSKAGYAWKEYKGKMRKKYISDKSDLTRWNSPEKAIDNETWKNLVKLWDDPHYQEKQEINKQNRAQQDFQHCTGSKPHCNISHEYFCKHGHYPDDVTLYMLCYTKDQDGKSWKDEVAKQKWDQIQDAIKEMPPEMQDTIEGKNDAFNKVFGSEKSKQKNGKKGKLKAVLDAKHETELKKQEEELKKQEECLMEERRLLNIQKQDWEDHKIAQQQKWIEEGARQFERDLHQQTRHMRSDTPPFIYEDSEYMNVPLLQHRRSGNTSSQYVHSDLLRHNYTHLSRQSSQIPNSQDDHSQGWRRPHVHTTGSISMSSLQYGSTSPSNDPTAISQPNYTRLAPPPRNEFMDMLASYQPPVNLANQSQEDRMS